MTINLIYVIFIFFDEDSLVAQLEKASALDRINMPYHQKIINKEIPYTIGGGIG